MEKSSEGGVGVTGISVGSVCVLMAESVPATMVAILSASDTELVGGVLLAHALKKEIITIRNEIFFTLFFLQKFSESYLTI